MKLIFSPASPFVRKVRVMVHEAGLCDQVEHVPVKTTALATDPEVRAANPLGKIPTLLLDDGRALFDSRVICRYLDDLSGGVLYPEDWIWDILTLEALADGIMESAVLMVYESRLRNEEERSKKWVDAQWAKVTHALDSLEANGFVAMQGPLNFGQLSIICALGYLDFRHDSLAWREGRPALAKWHEGLKQRASIKDTLPSN
tara:strand:+ start:268 stop:873 length:606 start_codon:yes stop_codon:yes gene_type:complete